MVLPRPDVHRFRHRVERLLHVTDQILRGDVLRADSLVRGPDGVVVADQVLRLLQAVIDLLHLGDDFAESPGKIVIK